MDINGMLFLLLFIAPFSIHAPAHRQGAAPPAPAAIVEKVSDDLFIIRGDGGNTSVYVTDDGIVLVDSKFERDHDELVRRVADLSNKPIKYIINTHPHTDHTGGNAFLSPGVIIAHENALTDMMREKLPGLPQITYATKITVRLAGKEIEAYHFGRCHTDGDTFVYFPGPKVLAAGDCITTGNGQGVANPPNSSRIFIDYKNGGSLVEAINTVNQALKLDFDVVVPGHGPTVKKADVARWHSGLLRLRDRVSSMLREGKDKREISDVLVNEFQWDATGNPLRSSLEGLISELRP
jgi:cyclase